MVLPVDQDSFDYKFNKTLNEDVKLISNEYGEWDIVMEDKDYVNVTGLQSLNNACIIAILTRFHELHDNPVYSDFGCHVHELVKDNQTKLHLYKMELFIRETLESMRRVSSVDEIRIKKEDANQFSVFFNITSIDDETVKGEVII